VKSGKRPRSPCGPRASTRARNGRSSCAKASRTRPSAPARNSAKLRSPSSVDRSRTRPARYPTVRENSARVRPNGRRGHNKVACPGRVVEKHLEGRQEHHVERGPVRPRELPATPRDVCREVDGVRRPLHAPVRWARCRVALPKMLMWKRYHESRAFSGHGARLLAAPLSPRNEPGLLITHSAPLSPRNEEAVSESFWSRPSRAETYPAVGYFASRRCARFVAVARRGRRAAHDQAPDRRTHPPRR
jgi:hypothetical protein